VDPVAGNEICPQRQAQTILVLTFIVANVVTGRRRRRRKREHYPATFLEAPATICAAPKKWFVKVL
jgi:hypothetical protein